MAHRIYQGKTGVVWNITQRSVGVLLKKLVHNRYRTKRLHVRIERVRLTHQYRLNHKKDPKKYPKRILKRLPKGPDPACLVDVNKSRIIDLKIRPHVDKVE